MRSLIIYIYIYNHCIVARVIIVFSYYINKRSGLIYRKLYDFS